MKPYQERVVEEKKELNEKIKRLAAFMGTPDSVFPHLPDDEKDRMTKQLLIMTEYSKILGDRIASFQ